MGIKATALMASRGVSLPVTGLVTGFHLNSKYTQIYPSTTIYPLHCYN